MHTKFKLRIWHFQIYQAFALKLILRGERAKLSNFDFQFEKSLYLGVGWSKLGFEGVFEHLIFMDLGSVFKIFLVKMGLK